MGYLRLVTLPTLSLPVCKRSPNLLGVPRYVGSAIHTSHALASFPHLPLYPVSFSSPFGHLLHASLFYLSLPPPVNHCTFSITVACLFMKLLFCSSDLRTESTVASSGRWSVWRVVSSSRFVRSVDLPFWLVVLFLLLQNNSCSFLAIF